MEKSTWKCQSTCGSAKVHVEVSKSMQKSQSSHGSTQVHLYYNIFKAPPNQTIKSKHSIYSGSPLNYQKYSYIYWLITLHNHLLYFVQVKREVRQWSEQKGKENYLVHFPVSGDSGGLRVMHGNEGEHQGEGHPEKGKNRVSE